MSTVLTHAFNQWSNRPADERFASLESLHSAALDYRTNAATATIDAKDLHVIAQDGAVLLNGRSDRTAQLTHHAFGQLANKAGAPASYLRTLPATLAADCLNQGLRTAADEDRTSKALFDRRDGLTARALTSDRYSRIWNADVTARLLRLSQETEWRPAPAAFDGSRGLYLGDKDMFVFLVDNERRIFERDGHGGLGRGFFCWNSEVGAQSFGIMRFLYEYVCGNHRVWGAKEVVEYKVRHIGDADERGMQQFAVQMSEYANSSAAEDEAKILACKQYKIAANKDELIDRIFGMRIPVLGRKQLQLSYDKAAEHSDWYGDPLTAWGIAGGITEIARDLPNGDERVALDRAANKVMELAF